jgi:hypothetical protein
MDLAGWLFGRVEHRRSWWTAFERGYFPVRRWHLALGELGWVLDGRGREGLGELGWVVYGRGWQGLG